MNQIYFEAKGESLLEKIGMSKSEFAKRMGIRKQNVKILFKSKNLETIRKASEVIGVPIEMLIGYIKEPNLNDQPLLPPNHDCAIKEDDIPIGTSQEDIAVRRRIIANFYREWKIANPSLKQFNFSLNEYINIRFVSITETCSHACRTYLSTLAVLQLDAILAYAKKMGEVPTKANGNQKPFEKMIVMHYQCPGIGTVKMTVGVRRGNHEKVQYCITTIDTIRKQEAE